MISIEELTVEIARQRDVLKRIEALVWYEPEDDDDLVEAVRVMACERNEALSQIRGRQAEFAELHAEVERLRARVRLVDRSTAYEGTAFSDGESSQEDLAIVASERDEARSERERLRRERDYALAEVSRRDREHDALVETAQKALAHVASERDEARAEVERLRTALAQAQRADE